MLITHVVRFQQDAISYGHAIVNRTNYETCKSFSYRKEVSWTHGGELDEGLEGEDGREEVVAVRQHGHKEG